MKKYKLENMPYDLEMASKKALYCIDNDLSNYEEGMFKRLATEGHSIDMICVVLDYKKRELEKIINDINELQGCLSAWRKREVSLERKQNETNTIAN